MNLKLFAVVLVVFLVALVLLYLFSSKYNQTEVSTTQERFLVTAEKQADVEGTVKVEAIIKIEFDQEQGKFLLNGALSPELRFWAKDGSSSYYEFQNHSGHPFYFGTEEEGSSTMSDALDLYKGQPQALTEGSIFFNFDEHAPSTFYYHSPLVKNAGNRVNFITTA